MLMRLPLLLVPNQETPATNLKALPVSSRRYSAVARNLYHLLRCLMLISSKQLRRTLLRQPSSKSPRRRRKRRVFGVSFLAAETIRTKKTRSPRRRIDRDASFYGG